MLPSKQAETVFLLMYIYINEEQKTESMKKSRSTKLSLPGATTEKALSNIKNDSLAKIFKISTFTTDIESQFALEHPTDIETQSAVENQVHTESSQSLDPIEIDMIIDPKASDTQPPPNPMKKVKVSNPNTAEARTTSDESISEYLKNFDDAEVDVLRTHQEALNLFFMDTITAISRSPSPPHSLSYKWMTLLQKLISFAQTDDQHEWVNVLTKLKQKAMVKSLNPNYRASLTLKTQDSPNKSFFLLTKILKYKSYNYYTYVKNLKIYNYIYFTNKFKEKINSFLYYIKYFHILLYIRKKSKNL
jgi:hypothetical protein